MQVTRSLRLSACAGIVPLLLAILFTLTPFLQAFPPTPQHLFYGTVRDEYGNPLEGEAEVLFETASGKIITIKINDLQPGMNYRLVVPMDSSRTTDLYKPMAMRPSLPFKMKVKIDRVIYLPIEMMGDLSLMGKPGEKTRLDLTLGEDADGDGIPDAWERAMLEALGKDNLTDIDPSADADGDGLNNLQEYLAGTYPMDKDEGLALTLLSIGDTAALVEFLTIRGRTYFIQGSHDLVQWNSMNFILNNDASRAERSYHTGEDIEFKRVEIVTPVGQTPAQYFRLIVK